MRYVKVSFLDSIKGGVQRAAAISQHAIEDAKGAAEKIVTKEKLEQTKDLIIGKIPDKRDVANAAKTVDKVVKQGISGLSRLTKH